MRHVFINAVEFQVFRVNCNFSSLKNIIKFLKIHNFYASHVLDTPGPRYAEVVKVVVVGTRVDVS